MRDNPPSPPHLNDVVFGGRLICAFRAAYPTFAKLIHTQYSKNHWDGGRGGINHQFDFLHWKIYHEKTVWKWICLTNLSYRCIWKWKKMKLFPSKCLTVGLLINQTRPIFLKFNRVLHYFFTQKRTQNTIPRPTHQQLLYLLTIFL